MYSCINTKDSCSRTVTLYTYPVMCSLCQLSIGHCKNSSLKRHVLLTERQLFVHVIFPSCMCYTRWCHCNSVNANRVTKYIRKQYKACTLMENRCSCRCSCRLSLFAKCRITLDLVFLRDTALHKQIGWIYLHMSIHWSINPYIYMGVLYSRLLTTLFRNVVCQWQFTHCQI